MTKSSTRGEMDITTVFGTVIAGSSPAGCTKTKELNTLCLITIVFAPGRTRKTEAVYKRALRGLSASRGRKYLDFYERNEIKSLVTCDQVL